MAVTSRAVFSLLGLIVLVFVIKYFIFDSLPDFKFQEDPWKLLPSVYSAVVITGVRFLIYRLFKSKGEKFAEKQIQLSKPDWAKLENITSDTTNDTNSTNGCKDNENINDHSTLKHRQKHENGTINSSSTPTQNGFTNEINVNLTLENITKIFELARNNQTKDEILMKMCHNMTLTDDQIRDIKRFRKVSLEFASSVSKYLEVYFKLFMTTIIMLWGIYVVMWRSDVFWRPEIQFTDYNSYPPQKSDIYIKFYYWISLGYHLHRCMFQFFNHARKDFWAMFIHHWSTIFLIFLSWCAGFNLTGALVMFLHDNGDFWLPLAKIFRYNQWTTAKDVCFVIFTYCWLQFRMYWFSTKVIYTVYTYGFKYYVVETPCGTVCFVLLFVLEILHIYWFTLILAIIKNLFVHGRDAIEDVRSDVPPDSKLNEKQKQKQTHQE